MATRKILLFIAACIMAFSANARDPQRGYRGFVDWENTIGNTDYTSNSDGSNYRECAWMSGISTSHGYQFNSHIFLGIGAAFVFMPMVDGILPVFVNFRYDYSHRKFRPFGDFRIGYNFYNGFYMSPTIGYRLNWGRKVNLNFGLGVTVCGKTKNIGTPIPSDSPEGFSYSWEKKNYADTFFTLRIGIDF